MTGGVPRNESENQPMGGIKIWHIVVLIIAFVVLFGWKNLPSMARSLGESMRVFKAEVDQMKDDGEARKGDKDALGEADSSARTAERRAGDTAHDRYGDTPPRDYREQAEHRPDEPRA